MTLPADRQRNSGPDPERGELLPQGESIVVSDIRDALVIKEGSLFLMTDPEGNVPLQGDCGYGLYKGDTRYLSAYDLSFDGIRPTVLLSTAELGYSSEHHLTNPAMATADDRLIPKETLEITRQRLISGSMLETIQITNYNIAPVTIRTRIDFGADFLDIFEFRGEVRPRRGTVSEPEVGQDRVVFIYEGLDGVRRRTVVKFSPSPDQIWANGAVFVLSLRHRESTTITVTVSTDGNSLVGSFAGEFERLVSTHRDWINSCTQVFTNNQSANTILQRSLNDIRMLMVEDGGSFVAAGTPWYSSLFGRDSLISSIQMLAFNPEVARSSLRILARWQGKKVDDWRDEEPGKILHELRTGEMASLDEIPMHPYYGSVDSTPLFLMLAAEYVAWTGDLDLIRELEPNLMAALEWIQNHLAESISGYLEYARRSSKGLLNQGWKDSGDGVVNADGTLVRPPVALAEAQGYVFAAKRGAADLLSLLGKTTLATNLSREADDLMTRFNQDFWLEDQRFFAVALGKGQEKAASLTSNPGQCLWTGIVEMDKASMVVDRLFSNDLFSGWGMRTLSSGAARYNPLGYHLGTVWPHDNSLIGMGLKRYGFEQELNELATAMYDCCLAFDYYRLPELFSGVARTAHNLPVRYPVACQPQAWAAGAFPLLLQAMLGLVPYAHRNELRIVRPSLPHWLDEVEVRGLRVGDRTVDLLYQRRRGRTTVSVMADHGVNVVVRRRR